MHVHQQSWGDKCTAWLWSPLMGDYGRVSLSDWSSSDVRRCLHGGCCLATRLPDHCQLPSVPPTQTLALWITLHEHAQRREFGSWMWDTRPSSSIHPSVSQPAASISFPWVPGAETIELEDQMWWTRNIFLQEIGIDVMCCMLEVSWISGLSNGYRWELQHFIWMFHINRIR